MKSLLRSYIPRTYARFLSKLCAIICIVTAAYIPPPAFGACQSSALPSYEDVRYVSVNQGSLVGVLHPSYQYEAAYYPATGSVKAHALVSLSAKRAVPFRGDYVAVDPIANFQQIVAVLRAASFFEMRMTPARNYYIDGPEDSVSVGACGITWTLGTISRGGEVELDDPQGRRFFKLEKDLRTTIFSGKWTQPTPLP